MILTDGTKGRTPARVSGDNRLTTEAITEPISSERSRAGRLWGAGTGSISVSSSMSLGPVLWIKNTGVTYDWYVQKLVYGWNGGTTNHNRTVLSFIKYQTTEPTGANTAINAAIENISKSGSAAAVTNTDFTGHKWDESGTGMTGGTGGYLQIPNRLAIGNTSIPIDGEIILGPGDSMELQITPEEDGLFNAAIVFYEIATGKERAE